jgi:hypothetical protein
MVTSPFLQVMVAVIAWVCRRRAGPGPPRQQPPAGEGHQQPQDEVDPAPGERPIPRIRGSRRLRWKPSLGRANVLLDDGEWADGFAGVAVAALIVPKNLGYAGIAGIPLQNGLYADESEVQGSKRQRVAPYGSALATPNTVWGVKRYRCQGGGPALGALNGAVNPSPSTCAGHPSSR